MSNIVGLVLFAIFVATVYTTSRYFSNHLGISRFYCAAIEMVFLLVVLNISVQIFYRRKRRRQEQQSDID